MKILQNTSFGASAERKEGQNQTPGRKCCNLHVQNKLRFLPGYFWLKHGVVAVEVQIPILAFSQSKTFVRMTHSMALCQEQVQ